MIFGSFTTHSNRPEATELLELTVGRDRLAYQSVSFPGFTGGFYLQPNLPYKKEDYYYWDEANDIGVFLSGSVYNRAGLLSSCNLSDQTGDPELIAALFLKEGAGFVKELNGDFAFMIIRSLNKEVYLFRDHLGIRPMAYTVYNYELNFSSDIVDLCRTFSSGTELDINYLTGAFRFIDYRTIPCMDVEKLLPGHFLHFSREGMEITKYWKPEKIRTDKTLTHDKMLADLKSILKDAVRIRCDRRFTAGAHTSSGLDSGIISALARKEYAGQETFYGFSWSPSDYDPVNTKYDERDLIRKLCGQAGITPLFSDLNGKNFPAIISSYYENYGYFSEYRTISQAVQKGVNLIFSGWGGDEFISTAAPAIETDLLRTFRLGLYLRRNQVRQPKKFFKNVVYYVLFPALGILDRKTVNAFRDNTKYLKKPYNRFSRKVIKRFYFHTSRRGHHLGMLDFYHLQDRCEKWYIMGYRNGMEYRFPLLDRRIIEYMLKVPSVLLCEGNLSRPVLREAGKGILPEEIRLNKSKSDPVYREYMSRLFENTASSLVEEIDKWKMNEGLLFIDFDSLSKDIEQHKKSPGSINTEVLSKMLVYSKAIYEFAKIYQDGLFTDDDYSADTSVD